MSKKIIIALAFSCFLFACKKNIFGPNKGDISGVVTDIHANPIQSVDVSSSFIIDNEDVENPKKNTVNTSTDENGEYFLNDVGLSENEIKFTKEGYKELKQYINLTQENNNETFNVKLIGAPEFITITTNSNILSISNTDTITVSVNIKDEYNESSSPVLNCSLLIYDTSNNLVLTKQMNLSSSSLQNFLFDENITPADLNVGNYALAVEFYDNETSIIKESNIKSISVIN
jgi:hypothetical protein